MHVLHGSWLPQTNQLAIWGENAAALPSYRKGRRGAIAPHPFAMTPDQLLRYVVRFTTDSKPDGKVLNLLLPGAGKKVQPSPQATDAGYPIRPTAELELLTWEISTVTLKATDALDFLLQLPGEPRGFQIGSDLAYWQQAALLVVNCLVEGRYIPAMAQKGTQYTAHWEARPGPDLMEQLAENMPTLCRALHADLSTVPEPYDLLDAFLSGVLDTFIREYYQHNRVKTGLPWMVALTGRSNIIKDTVPTMQRLYKAWEEWQTVGGGAGTFRVCFRLEEPKTEQGDWRVDYLLQANDDPSLLVPAATVWAARSNRLEYLERRFDNPQQKLLAALGLASRFFDPIERSLRGTHPTSVDLDRDEAFTFLTQALPMLESSGFSVLIPNWWQRRNRLKARARVRGQTETPTGFLTHDTLVNYTWEMSLGEESISREEFEELVALKQPLVRHKGEWIALDPEQINAALNFFQQADQTEGKMTVLDALKVTAGVDSEVPDGIEIEGTMVEGWLDELFERLRQPENALVPDIPDSLHATLRPYQERGFGWLSQMRSLGLGACLADDMGLGKTIQTITLLLHEREKLGVDRPALLVCPTSVVGNWSHEIARFAPSLRVMKHQGPGRLKDKAFIKATEKMDVVLTSYALLNRDFDTLKQINWSNITLDEAQNIKNPSTKQAQAARGIEADQRMALTGTPVENRLTELWSIFQFLNPGYLGSQQNFRSRFSTPIERYGDEESAATLKQLTAPFILRRVKTDPKVIQDLPDKFENKVYCPLTSEQATLYEATVREEMEAITESDDDMQRRGNVLRMLTRLKQVCNHPAHFLKEGVGTTMLDRSGKLTRITEMMEEIREMDERALIFTQYAEMGHLLQAYLRDILIDEVLFLHGGTPAKKREEMVRQFQAPSGPSVFLLSLKAGGTGLNLTAANHVFHFDRWYNPAVENQATDRAFRIGQTRDVQVHKFICLGTLEERIDQLIEHKQALADQIVGSGESWISELNNDALHDLVALRQEAI